MSDLRNEAAAARQLLQELAAAQAEPLDDETVDIVVESETGLKEAIARAVMQMRIAKAEAIACEELSDAIIERSRRHSRRVDRIRDAISMAMEFAGVTKLALPEATLTISDRKKEVVVTDESVLPKEFVKTRVVERIDFAKLGEAMRAGASIPGATLDNGGRTLTIRTK